MIAYHGSDEEKSAILAQLAAHRKADELIHGTYWQDGKGCAVGCTIHSGKHAEYESRFGIPEMLAHLEDRIFEGLPNGASKQWPERFMGAIRCGADLSRIGWRFLHWLLTDEKVNPGIKYPLVADAVAQCADLMLVLIRDGKVSESARSAARSAAWSARSAAESAAWSAARSAAWSAAWSAWSAAESAARSAAESAARNAAESAARSAAESAARNAAYVLMANKLVELLEAA